MSLNLFMQKNKMVKENVKYAATKSLRDEKGNPLEWEIKPLSTKDTEQIRLESTIETKNSKGIPVPKVDTGLYLSRLATSSVVYPNLKNAELQDSYGVKKAEDLILEMIDDPGEYNNFIMFIQKLNGFDVTMSESVDIAKN